jgi:hypothetical protein
MPEKIRDLGLPGKRIRMALAELGIAWQEWPEKLPWPAIGWLDQLSSFDDNGIIVVASH